MSTRDVLRDNDARFRAVAATLGSADWSQPSLCEAWSNHDVLAHLVVGCRIGIRDTAGEMLRHGGSFDRANAALAQSLAATRTPAQLLDDFGRLMHQPRGLGRVFPRRLLLGDHVTHELDILFALGHEPSIPSEVATMVLNTQVAVPNPFVPAFRNSRGLRLCAMDAEWTHGNSGPLVEGPAAELISVLGSRPRMLSALRGDGVEVLASRVNPPRIRRGG